MGIENAELAEFADSLWENYMKFRNKEADAEKVSFYKAKVTANPGGGYLTIKKPFDAIAYNVACPSYMANASVGLQVLVLRFGNGTNLMNHFIIDNAARTMLASAIATGSSITFPISVANGGTGATTLSGAKTNLEIPTVTLNGSASQSPSFYAPTSAGTNGYVLTSNGSGAPSWAVLPSSGNSAVYATCSTQNHYNLVATVAAGQEFSLTTGANVFVSFTYARPQYEESFDLTLNVNSTGAKTIKFAGDSLSATDIVSPIYWNASEVVEFVYDGTYWQMVGKYEAASTTSYGVTILSSAVNSTDTGAAATSAAVKTAYDLANSRSYALSMSSNVITLTGQDGNVSSVTLPVWDGSYT